MAYRIKELYELALKIIEDKNIFFITDLVAFMPCDRTTFYRKFPPESNKYNTIKDLLENNRIKTKQQLKAKWYKSDNATKQLALYKLIGTDEERKRLSISHHEVEHSGEIKGDKTIKIGYDLEDDKV